MTKATRENVYTCNKCGGYTVTVDIDEGVTPFMILCRAKDMFALAEPYCDGTATSAFYPKGPRPPHIPAPAWEWYRPSQEEAAKENEIVQEHIRLGGLVMRRISTP